MPFPFVYVCDLLEDLARLSNRESPLLPKVFHHAATETTLKWLKLHRSRLDAAATDDDAVILTLQPEKRTDRVYEGLDSFGLEQVIARVLNLPRRHFQVLQRWRHEPAKGDLATCVERVMKNMAAENQRIATSAQAGAVTVEQIDQSLLRIASHSSGSSAEVRSLALEDEDCDTIEILGNFYRRLTSREAKWLTRLILKDYGPGIKFPDSLICKANHSFLPRCVQVRAEFSSSIPPSLRRDGPGSLRLADAAKSTSNLLPTPPATAPEPVYSTSHKVGLGTGLLRSPSTKTQVSKSPIERTSDHGSPTRRSKPPELRLSPSIFNGGRSKCQLSEQTCPLANCLFILAPCIATTPWLTENLLPWHGSCFVTSLQALSSPTLPRRCPQTGKKYRKIALVEPNRPEQTIEFLKMIGRLNLTRSRGKKQWVEVYDWRILECIAKIDRGKKLDYNPWRRCWMGAV